MLDAGFPLALLQEAEATRYVVRLAKNATFRRATPPPYRGRGRPPTRGAQLRPLPRVYKGRLHVATAPDEEVHWEEGHVRLRAAIWRDLLPPTAGPDAPTLTVVAITTGATTTPGCWPAPAPRAAGAARPLP